MMCADCHHVFSDEDAQTVLEHHGEFSEPFPACPNCGSFDLDPAERCSSCGEFHRLDELFGSHHDGKMCKGCLRQACDAEAFADFGTLGYADDELSDLEAFVLCRILLLPELPKRSSAEFREAMTRIFWEEVNNLGCVWDFRDDARKAADERVRVRLFDDWLAMVDAALDGHSLDEFADYLYECRAPKT